MKKKPPGTLHLVVPPQMQSALRKKAESLEINLSEAVRRAIHAYLAQQEIGDRMTK